VFSDNSANTSINVIEDCVAPGATVLTGCWSECSESQS